MAKEIFETELCIFNQAYQDFKARRIIDPVFLQLELSRPMSNAMFDYLTYQCFKILKNYNNYTYRIYPDIYIDIPLCEGYTLVSRVNFHPISKRERVIFDEIKFDVRGRTEFNPISPVRHLSREPSVETINEEILEPTQPTMVESCDPQASLSDSQERL